MGGPTWYEFVFELIDMRSFSNLWYWIGLAVMWSSVSHFVLGVPFDMLVRARRQGGQAERDFEDMVRITVNRICHIEGRTGLWAIGFVSFFLTILGLLGFYYKFEFSQAVFFLAAPLTIVAIITIRTAHRIARDTPTGEDLRKRIVVARFWIQVVGMISIFVTSLWGMIQNFQIGGIFG